MIGASLRQPRARWLVAAGVAMLALLAWAATASADQPDNQVCLSCHSQPGLSTTLASGEVLPLTVDPAIYNSSMHGKVGQACVACHTDITGYPHPKLTAPDRRGFQIQQYTECKSCHQTEYNQTLDSNHARALAGGNQNAAICTDCHGAHDVQKPGTPRQEISLTCRKCHSAIYDQYTGSVHGAALAQTSNPDVPVCTDCHGVHQQADPTTAAFRLKSPSICAKCHGNASLMEKYGISTDVMNSYVADFHGTTVTLFEKQSPDQQINEAVCTDCHGVHDIKAVTSKDATVVKQNLLKTCQKCHPDATANFPDAWVGHWPPSATSDPLVYYVNLFYKILIPSVIGGMGLFVAVDASRRIWDRLRRKKGA